MTGDTKADALTDADIYAELTGYNAEHQDLQTAER